MNASEEVTCRVKPTMWWIIPLGIGEAAFMLVAPFEMAKSTQAGRPIWPLFVLCWPFALLMLCGVGHYALSLVRGFVRADAKGLRWRVVGKTRNVNWTEVTDFYDSSPSRGARKFAIETRAGALKLDGQWTNTGALRDFIQTHATNSQSRAWALQPKGEKWPRIFHYRGWDNRWFLPIMTVLGIFGVPCLLASLLFRPEIIRSDFAVFGLLLGILFIIGRFCLMFVLPVLYALTFWPMLREVRRRQNERITATPDGLIFEDGARHIEARWDEITNFYIAPSTRKLSRGVYVVETTHGNFDFVQEIGPYQGLQSLILERATNSASREWKRLGAENIETLGGEEGKWRDGQRLHSYRTRSNRALLWGAMFFGAVSPINAWLRIHGFYPMRDAPSTERNIAILVLVAGWGMIVSAIWGWWAYYKFSIRTDEHGLTQTGWRGERFVAWEDIVDFYCGGTSFYIVSKDGMRLRFGSNIADAIELRDTITERSGQDASNGT